MAEVNPNGARIVKKYQNRKLYDMRDSQYVTLADIAEMIRRNEEVVVVDNETKEDVTILILTQILYDQEKNHKTVLPISILKTIIQAGSGSVYDFIHKYIVSENDSIGATQVEAERYIDRLVAKGELSKGEAKTLLNDLSEVATKNIETLYYRIDERVSVELQKTTTFNEIRNTVAKLNTKIDALEKRLAVYEGPHAMTPPSHAKNPTTTTYNS